MIEDMDYAVALGKMCGCGQCVNCWAYESMEWNKAWEEGRDERAKKLDELFGWSAELKTFLQGVK